jgi:CRISPR-associated protein Csb2
MFGFEICYLRGSVTAADISRGSEKDEVEWPPHPDRLFCALVQAWADRGSHPAGRAALEWLEALGPPLVRCGQILSSHAVQRYVPVNDNWSPWNPKKDKAFAPIQETLLARDRKPRRFAVGTLADEVVRIWWPEAAPEAGLAEELEKLARGVSCLGHSSSLVAVDLCRDLESLSPSLVPRPDGIQTLRVPTPGRLRALEGAWQTGRRPPLAEWATYGAPETSMTVLQGHHRELIVFRLTSDRPPLPLEAAGRLTALWRRALLERADQPVSEAVSGHAPGSTPENPRPSQQPHLALLPLADVGHRFARSHLLGVAAALPARLAPFDRRACLRALGRVEKLTLGSLGLWQLERCDATERRSALQPETWCHPARLWASVTPVVFGKYPGDLFGEEARSLIREACTIAGLPEPIRVAVAPVAWVVGAPPAFRFPPLPSRPGKPKRAHVHALLEFERPVAGPVLVGAGRHLGYGLFRQLAGGET